MNRPLAILALTLATPALAESLHDYSASATVVVTAQGEGLHRVELPFEVHRGARPDLADVRMFNAKGELLPFAFAATPSPASAMRALDTVTVGGRRGMKPGEYIYDLQAAVPVSRVQLVFAEANAVAPIELFARNEDGAWRQVGLQTFYRLTRGGVEVRSPPLEIPPYPARYWMLQFDAKAGAPTHAPRLEAGFRPREIVFAARGEGPYQLAFGKDEGKRADLPLATLIPKYERDAEYQLPKARVAAVGSNAPPGWSLSRYVTGDRGKKTLLWVVLLGGVVVLSFMAWRLSR